MNRYRSILILGFILSLAPAIVQAAVSATELTSAGDGSQQLTYTTASITPAANQLILAWIMNSNNNPVDVPTLSGNGLTWVQVNTVAWNTTVTPTYRITLFRAMGAAPTTGSVSISFATKQRAAAWSIVEFSGVNTSGTNGSSAVIQNATGSNDAAGPSGLTITLPSAIASGNATAGGFGNDATAFSISPGTGYTAFTEVNVGNPHLDLRTEWRADGQTTVNATQSGSNPMAGIAVEVGTAALPLVKQVWDSSGTNCLASIPADATCNSSATSVTVPRGTTLKILIYIRNTSTNSVTDVRFQDLLDDSASGFTYTASSIKRTPNDGTAPADTATNATILAAATTAQTDAVGGPDDFASITDSNANGKLDKVTVGAVTGQANQSLSFQANKTFAIQFTVTKN